MVNIKVAVRIRPLSQRELLSGEEIIVRKENKTILVTNPKIPGRQDGDSRQRTRRFAVDFCYDSREPKDSTQEAVYNEIGREVLHSMYEGYNACVLAYGHSASGKTYTIMGLQTDPGLTPRLCEGLFERCPEERIRVQVIVSFLEIYNEKVRDLLGSEETGATFGNFSLRVREHPKLGPYVQGLSEHSVADKAKLLQLLTAGNRRRSTAATESNIHSSRSHAVFTVHFKQSDGDSYETEKWSKVHLVDLAGSERARSSQSKARLQEGANINKSLATLGNVISALAEGYESGVPPTAHSSSKTWQPFVPYRDSVLTWLLKDTLGGNSNTIMIATVSPASSCISETVNTLRYAKRAKKIVNQPIINEDPKIRTIRELRKEIARLKDLLTFLRSCGREVDLWEGHSEVALGKATALPRPESKWPEPEGTRITIKAENQNKKGSSDETSGNPEAEIEEDKTGEGDGKEKSRGDPKPRRKRESTAGVSGGDACEIDDEKKSDVNGSVNDNFSHETQFFSDSLESFSPLLLKSGNSWAADDDCSGKPETGDDEIEMRVSAGQNLATRIRGEFDFHENLSKGAAPEMLHRSRPDLIKGISMRAKDNGLPLGSSQSCTDVSNLSHSTSENSLNSSGSAEVQPAENRSLQNPAAYGPMSAGAGAEKRQKGTGKNDGGNGAAGTTEPPKKEKRLEIVEAVTSRLYAAKKKPDRRTELLKKEENDDDCGDLEDLKLCKRARMKLFDLSRKLAMNRKMKKTVDSNTQTDCATGTLRVKEKCVTTEPSGALGFEASIAEESSKQDKKPYVIMNQVFIPRAANCVVECGEVVRVEGPEVPPRQESATQTTSADKRYKNADTSPICFSPREEDSFSEDSLDLEVKGVRGHESLSGGAQLEEEKKVPEVRMRFNWPADLEICLFRDSIKHPKEESMAPMASVKSQRSGLDAEFNGLPLPVFVERRANSDQQMGFFLTDSSSGVPVRKKQENMSSENSFASVEGTERNSSSETSSEDFMFYENPKELTAGRKTTSDRELYTIAENSEQSDPSDALSPVQRQRHYFRMKEDGEQQGSLEDEVKEEGKEEKFLSGRGGPDEANGRISPGHFDEVLGYFQQAFDSYKSAQDNLKVPKPASSPAGDPFPKLTDRLTRIRTGCRLTGNTEPGSETERIDFRCSSANFERKTNQTKWTDSQANCQKQYLNLNISGSGGVPPFSVDSHLFGKTSDRDQSADAVSTSADSITFVFMGPATPKTSFLMEIIGRSLGRCSPANEIPFGRRKSRSRGVQCDASLMRSVSVDTAMIALSRIARNQEALPEMQRTTSLGKLNSDEMLGVLGGGNLQSQLGSSCRCEPESGYLKGEQRKCALKYSVGTSTGTDEEKASDPTKSKKSEAERPKKSVSWFEESQREEVMKWREIRVAPADSDEPDVGSEDGDLPESANGPKSKASGFSDFPERRVRFLKAKTWDVGEVGFDERREEAGSEDNLTAFLREATQLLKNINSRSSKQSAFSQEAAEDAVPESNRRKEETRKGGLKTSKKGEAVTKTRAEDCLEKEGGWCSGERRGGEKQLNLTWPRRRGAMGKPPTGTRARYPRSPLPSRFEPIHSSTTSNLRSWSPCSRQQSWNLSNLSVALSNSYPGENDSRPPSSRSSYCNEISAHRDFYPLAPTTLRRTFDHRPNFDPLYDLELDLEEYCRRLEMTMEQDKDREKIRERKKKELEHFRDEQERPEGKEDAEAGGSKRKRDSMKRRAAGCAGGCVCGRSGREPCKRLWSRGCRSNFELDSFGPGSNHCHQRCMFCRKKETEMYYSAVSLNSECSSGLCRLNYYGFCPCSPVKLNQVALSPRAYMQRLLALRKQIVSESKHSQEERRHGSCRGSPWRSSLGLAPAQDMART